MIIKCPKCGQEKEAHHIDTHLCIECSKVESTRLTYQRQHQGDWIAEAKEQGLETWLQQPGETQWEYTVWTAYRDSYPGKKPTYSAVSQQLSTSYNSVQKIAQRWSFPIRMQLWMAECDRITMIQRKEEILEMNAAHISMATRLRNKLSVAVDLIDECNLKPGEIATLAKLSAEMERKARIDAEAQEDVRRNQLVDTTNPELSKQQTKQGDLGEVLQILIKAGALKSVTAIGVKETREIIVKGEDDGA